MTLHISSVQVSSVAQSCPTLCDPMRWKKIFHASGNQKKAGVAIRISDTIDFTVKTDTRDKEGHYIMIKDHSKKI